MSRPLQGSVESPAPQPDAAEVRAHLASLLCSDALAISDRNRRFLAYVVEETLGGRGDRIKAYNVALTAFDRNDDFDPQTDPIVRIEASRLRRALEHYYLTAGKADPMRIGIPKGSYVATFSYAEGEPARREPAAPSAVAEPVASRAIAPQPAMARKVLPRRGSRLWWFAALAPILLVVMAGLFALLLDQTARRARTAQTGPAILVLPFDGAGDQNEAFIAGGVTAALIRRLMLLQGAEVLAPSAQSDGERMAVAQPNFVLSGTAFSQESKIFVSATLVDARSGRYLWSLNSDYRFADQDVVRAQAAIAADISGGVAPLLQPKK